MSNQALLSSLRRACFFLFPQEVNLVRDGDSTAKINSRSSAILLLAIVIVCCLFRGVCLCVCVCVCVCLSLPVFIGHSQWLRQCHSELLLCVGMSGWEEKQCTVWPMRDTYTRVFHIYTFTSKWIHSKMAFQISYPSKLMFSDCFLKPLSDMHPLHNRIEI